MLVVLVIFFFLRSLRATLIPLVTIPVSLIGACTVIYALGFSINTLTLLAMVLAIGLVVDDAIVVLENIHRHIENGMKPVRAAITGIQEISGAVVAMTLTLAAVYAPVAFAAGRTGKLFTEFALTLAAAVLMSGLVALTLSPMMCAKLLREHEKPGRLSAALERGLDAVNEAYRRALVLSLKVRWLVVLLVFAVAGGSWMLLTTLKSELAPLEDRGVLFLSGSAPEGATIDFTSRYGLQVEEIIGAVPEVNSFFVIAGSAGGQRHHLLLAAGTLGDPHAQPDRDRCRAAAADPPGRGPARLGQQSRLLRRQPALAPDRVHDPHLRALRAARRDGQFLPRRDLPEPRSRQHQQ